MDQQLCRKLLLSLDRLPDGRLAMTQGLVANMLGVRCDALPTLAANCRSSA